VDDLLKLAYQELNDTFDHTMRDNRPVNIHASIDAAGSRSVPISGASQQNTHYHQAAFLGSKLPLYNLCPCYTQFTIHI
jgi:hypothetical protein